MDKLDFIAMIAKQTFPIPEGAEAVRFPKALLRGKAKIPPAKPQLRRKRWHDREVEDAS